MENETDRRLAVGGMPGIRRGPRMSLPVAPDESSQPTPLEEAAEEIESPPVSPTHEEEGTSDIQSVTFDQAMKSRKRMSLSELAQRLRHGVIARSGGIIARAAVVVVAVYLVVFVKGFTLLSVSSLALAVICIWFVYVTFIQSRWDGSVKRPVPQQGWQRKLRLLLRVVGISYVPNRGVQELIKVEETRHFDLASERNVFIGVFGPKGGVGKSTVVTSMAWLASGCNFTSNLILDARIKRGQIAERLGLWRRQDPTVPARFTTVTLRQYLDLDSRGMFNDPVQEQMLLGSPAGRQLLVVGSDMATKQEDLQLDAERVRMSTRSAKRRNQLVFAECSDDLFTPMDLMLMDEVDIPVFTHRVDSPGSAAELTQALSLYAGRSPEIARKIRERGVLMVLATHRRQKPEDFADLFRGDSFGGLISPERTLLVKYDEFFKQDHTDVGHDMKDAVDHSRPPRRSMELDEMPPAAALQYLRALNLGLEAVPVRQIQTSGDSSAGPDTPDGTPPQADPGGNQ